MYPLESCDFADFIVKVVGVASHPWPGVANYSLVSFVPLGVVCKIACGDGFLLARSIPRNHSHIKV